MAYDEAKPDLGRRLLPEIEPFEILTILKRMERRGKHESARRVREFAIRVFNYGIITSRRRTNPAVSLSAAHVSPKVKQHATK
ncbi:hypothetical protein AEAC466_12030 [Asticcacaulis sp. AC466]|uniref:phage integrase central domain-containing protein n=1 Tax=Asticcacaulis sp. AC466 TaxID=1282362 RepID=UPI0003C3F91F|nr:hypothetical protein [Asticcacaulis sp. AC466]ESQ83729.1 hypothetical protein AEAC466_12030 [Asticcacaulis sp. AC466]